MTVTGVCDMYDKQEADLRGVRCVVILLCTHSWFLFWWFASNGPAKRWVCSKLNGWLRVVSSWKICTAAAAIHINVLSLYNLFQHIVLVKSIKICVFYFSTKYCFLIQILLYWCVHEIQIHCICNTIWWNTSAIQIYL